jgi:hypothetical protein
MPKIIGNCSSKRILVEENICIKHRILVYHRPQSEKVQNGRWRIFSPNLEIGPNDFYKLKGFTTTINLIDRILWGTEISFDKSCEPSSWKIILIVKRPVSLGRCLTVFDFDFDRDHTLFIFTSFDGQGLVPRDLEDLGTAGRKRRRRWFGWNRGPNPQEAVAVGNPASTGETKVEPQGLDGRRRRWCRRLISPNPESYQQLW